MRLPKSETDIEITELRKSISILTEQNELLKRHLNCMISATNGLNCANVNDMRPYLGKAERNAKAYLDILKNKRY